METFAHLRMLIMESVEFRNEYLNCLIKYVLIADISTSILSDVESLVVKPFKMLMIDEVCIAGFFEQLLQTNYILRANIEFHVELMRSKYITKERKLEWLCENLLSRG
jgi:hypothetical protein